MRPLFLVSAILLASCTPIISHHGNRPLEQDLQKITIGVSSRDDVSRLLGSPSIVSLDQERFWLYLSYRRETLLFFEPQQTKRHLVAIFFDRKGVVSKIEQYDKEDGLNVLFAREKTPRTIGGSQNWIERVLGNIGRVLPTGGIGEQ